MQMSSPDRTLAGHSPGRIVARDRRADGGSPRAPLDCVSDAMFSIVDGLLGARGGLLTFHRVAPTATWAGLPNRGFYLSVALLDGLLSWLTRHGWDIVTLDEALRRVQTGDPRRFVNFSIDDTYRDTWELAVPLFHRYNAAVTLFVTTGIPDRTYVMWHAGMEVILHEQSEIAIRAVDGTLARRRIATPEDKRAAYNEIRESWERADPHAHYTAFCADNGYDPRVLHERNAIGWDMLSTMRDDPLVEIGAHTVSHPRISILPSPNALAEITGSRDRLRRQLDLPVRHFAFPYGRSADCGARDFELCANAGYASAATTRKGILRSGTPFDPYRLPRNTLNGSHARPLMMLQAHLSGATGVAARLLGRG
jgi:peptidoglycan/xylan/chitin deacetylase (PgdA/CDA1 family)